MAKKPNMGRQRIKIEKIEVKNHLRVTFSKRRSGLFKKASELCTLCGAEIAIIVFSPAGKVFSFGHPNVESVVDRFLARTSATNDPFHLQRSAGVKELNLQLSQMLNELELEREGGENWDRLRKANQSQYWWEGPIGKLGLDELEQLKDAMEELKRNVGEQMVNPAPTLFDEYDYETIPSQPITGGATSANNSTQFGYCHGFF